MIKLQHLDSSDKQWVVATLVAPLLAWWYFHGRNKYGVKGMK